MNDAVKFSVIVPVYNVYKYLRQCIDSVLTQQYDNFELILVNDGSTDDSGEICEGYAEKDSRVVYISKENGGVSGARNVGIRAATGEYIIFLDSDDWLCESILEKSSRIIAETGRKDLYLGDFYRYDQRTNKQALMAFTPRRAILDRANPYEVLACVMWSRSPFFNVRRLLFRQDLMFKHGIFFDEVLSWSEDTDYFISYVMKCESFGALGLPVGYYRVMREGSLTTAKNPEIARQGMKVRQEWSQYFIEEYEKNRNRAAKKTAGRLINEIFDQIVSLGEEKAKPLLKENAKLLMYTAGWRMAIKRSMYGLFGFDMVQRTITMLKKLRSSVLQKLGRGGV